LFERERRYKDFADDNTASWFFLLFLYADTTVAIRILAKFLPLKTNTKEPVLKKFESHHWVGSWYLMLMSFYMISLLSEGNFDESLIALFQSLCTASNFFKKVVCFYF